jgi:histidinol-phosphatase (PHP family)
MDGAMAAPRLIDYHLHTAVTIDGNMNEFEACERALAMGIHEIAFTNHVMLNQPNYLISSASFQKHWENIQRCKERYPRLQIRLGIEMDYYPDRETEIGATIEFYERLIGHSFDIVLGSVHEIRGGFFSNKHLAPGFFKDRDLISLYCEYFSLVTMAVKSRLYDVIAHPDLIKKYTDDLTPPVPFESYKSSVESFITMLIKCNVGIEVNTKGLKLKVKEPYPSMEFLKLYISKARSAGTDPIITLGSDAHRVDDIGFGISEMIESLHKMRVNKIASFESRKKSPITI